MVSRLVPFLEWLVFAQSRGQFQRLLGLSVRYAPPCLDAYRRYLPPVFEIPSRPLFTFFIVDYLRVSPWPFARYREAAVLLRAAYRDREGWFPLFMPVTTWIARQGGHHLGFPKFVTPSIWLQQENGSMRGHVSGHCGGPFAIDVTYIPLADRQLAVRAEPPEPDPALFSEPFLVLKPVGIGPRVHEVGFVHVQPPAWEATPGEIEMRGHEREMLPGCQPVLGWRHTFSGAMNLVSRRLC